MRGKVTRVPSAFNQSQQQSADAAAAPHRPQATKAGPETEEPKPVLVPFNPRGSTAGSSSSVQAAPLGQQQRAHMDTLLQVSSDTCRLCSCKMASSTMTALGCLFSLLACRLCSCKMASSTMTAFWGLFSLLACCLQKLASCVATHNWNTCLSMHADSGLLCECMSYMTSQAVLSSIPYATLSYRNKGSQLLRQPLWQPQDLLQLPLCSELTRYSPALPSAHPYQLTQQSVAADKSVNS